MFFQLDELGVAFEEMAEDDGGVFAESAIAGIEGGGGVRIDVELARYFALHEDGNDDFRSGFKRAGEIARIGIDVVDDDRFPRGSGSAANALVQGDAGVRSGGAFEGTQQENVAVAIFFQHIETDPIIAGKFFVKEIDDALHESFGGARRNGQRVEGRDEITLLGWCCGHEA
jgi:hypothetical protein